MGGELFVVSAAADLDADVVLQPGLRGTVRILGGPGTGKSTLLREVAAARIAAGADPESVLFLTGSGKMTAVVRSSLTAQLLGAGSPEHAALLRRAVIREPVVRSVHSYAFAIMCRAAARAGDLPPRLVTGAEQDGIIRELLAGDAAAAAAVSDGAVSDGGAASLVRWPVSLHAALSTEGFANELRDLLARCAERGVDYRQLHSIGRRCGRPEWSAAARFGRQYEQVMLLRSAVGSAALQARTPALGAAELVGAALDAFAVDPELLVAERSRIQLLCVDDAAHCDPQAAQLVHILSAGAELTLLAGDPHQGVFGFRGADPVLLTSPTSPVVRLRKSYRCSPAVAGAIAGVARALPGREGWRDLDGAGADEGSVRVKVVPSAWAEAVLIADIVRRAHVVDGMPWSELAVIVRSTTAMSALPRALAAAGVPVASSGRRRPLREHPGVQALLTVLAATVNGLNSQQAVSLMTGPLGRVDPVSQRQLYRALRRACGGGMSDEGGLLVAALTGSMPQLPAVLAGPVRRVRSVMAAASRSYHAQRDPRYTLWQIWERSGLAQRWVATADRGGVLGALADQDLRAVTTLFDIADDYVSRTSAASVVGLLDHIEALRLPLVDDNNGSSAEGVAVLSPHAALGRQWDLVVIAGLQDGLWPNTTPRGGVLSTQRLLDVIDGLGDEVSVRAPLLAEERRLLVAAMGRARRHLCITAVDGDSGGDSAVPSPFVAELARYAVSDDGADAESSYGGGVASSAAPSVLSLTAMVGRLRSVVCSPPGVVDDVQRSCAAQQLARLAHVGVPGADPGQWYGMVPVSSAEPLWSDAGRIVTVSPSTVQMLSDCPLRWFVQRHGGTSPRRVHAILGSVVHAIVADTGRNVEQLFQKLDTVWGAVPFDAPWYGDRELDRHRAMLKAFDAWRVATRHELTEVGTEVDIDGVIAHPEPGLPGVRVQGRIDRLERDAAGRLVVIDLKTSRSPVTKSEAAQHAQLALYQLGIAAADQSSAVGDQGMVPHGTAGGGRLVYLGKPTVAGAAQREQFALSGEQQDQWRSIAQQAAAATAGPTFVARVNPGCSHCPMRPTCPAHTMTGTLSPGRQCP